MLFCHLEHHFHKLQTSNGRKYLQDKKPKVVENNAKMKNWQDILQLVIF